MPTYSFRNKDTGEEWDAIMSWQSSVDYLEENPHIERFLSGAPSTVHGTGDRTKTDNGFKEVLSKISDANPNSALASTHGKKDPKSVKVRDIVQKINNKIGGPTG